MSASGDATKPYTQRLEFRIWFTPAEARWLARRRAHSVGAALQHPQHVSSSDAACDEIGVGAGPPARTPTVPPTVRALRNWRTCYLGVVWTLQCAGYYGILFWMPLLVSQMMPHASAPHVALLTAGPYTSASVAMLSNAWHSKRTGERRWHCAAPLLIAGACLALAPMAAQASTGLALLLLCGATSGVFCTYGPFFSWPAVWAGVGEEAACSVTIINSMGNVGGMVGPALVGLLSDAEGGKEAVQHVHAMEALGGCALLAGLMCACFDQKRLCRRK